MSASVFIGYDPKRGRYIMCLFDTFGANYTPVAVGASSDDSVSYEFAYDEGPFYCTFRRVPEGFGVDLKGTDKEGNLQPFGMKRLRPKL